MPQQWRLTTPGQSYNRGEGIVVYFNPESGNTHLINELTLAMLEQLAAHPRTAIELLEYLMQDPADARSAQALADVENTLTELERFDLVERAPA